MGLDQQMKAQNPTMKLWTKILCPCSVTITEINPDDDSSTHEFGHTISLTPTHSDASKENDDCTIPPELCVSLTKCCFEGFFILFLMGQLQSADISPVPQAAPRGCPSPRPLLAHKNKTMVISRNQKPSEIQIQIPKVAEVQQSRNLDSRNSNIPNHTSITPWQKNPKQLGGE